MSSALTLLLVAAEDPPPPPDPEGFLGTLAHWAEELHRHFPGGRGHIRRSADRHNPALIVLLTAVNALIKMVGPERIDTSARSPPGPGSSIYPLRYMVLPFLSVFFLTNPMCYTMGRFLPEAKKPAFYDATVSFVHPILGLFPHANAVSTSSGPHCRGITAQNPPIGDLAVRYILVGLVVIFMRGCTTEIIFRIMSRRTPKAQVA